MQPLMLMGSANQPQSKRSRVANRHGHYGLAVGFELYGMRTSIGGWLRRLSFVPAIICVKQYSQPSLS